MSSCGPRKSAKHMACKGLRRMSCLSLATRSIVTPCSGMCAGAQMSREMSEAADPARPTDMFHVVNARRTSRALPGTTGWSRKVERRPPSGPPLRDDLGGNSRHGA